MAEVESEAATVEQETVVAAPPVVDEPSGAQQETAGAPPTPSATAEAEQRAPSAETQDVAEADRSQREPQTTASVETGRHISKGRATWYEHPGTTASGEVFDPDQMTAAHHTLPFGTRVRVVNEKTGEAVIVRINDRIPRSANAMIDLSRASARRIGITGDGQVSLYLIPNQTVQEMSREQADQARP